jgi:hypothetical protein
MEYIMEYIDVEWIHQNAVDPVRLVSELDVERYEKHGSLSSFQRHGWLCNRHCNSPGTELGTTSVPPLAEINQSPEFNGALLSALKALRAWGVPMCRLKPNNSFD